MAVAIGIPSHMRPVPGSINIAPASFPLPAKAAKSTNPSEIAANFILSFNDALKSKALLELSLLFLDNGFWRDHLALTWELRTLQGPPRIYDFLKGAATSKDGFRLQNISVDASNVVRAPKFAPIDADGEVIGVQFFLNIDTVHGTGQGLVRLVEEAGIWKVFTLYTRLEELKGHEQNIFDRRPVGAEHGGKPGRSNWADKRAEALDYADGSEPAVLVVGMSLIIRRDGDITNLIPCRRRSSWPYSRCTSQDHGSEHARHRPERFSRRQLAKEVSSTRAARPGLVRSPAVPQLPAPVAYLHAEGQARPVLRVIRDLTRIERLD